MAPYGVGISLVPCFLSLAEGPPKPPICAGTGSTGWPELRAMAECLTKSMTGHITFEFDLGDGGGVGGELEHQNQADAATTQDSHFFQKAGC